MHTLNMSMPKIGTDSNGNPMHYSVGALIEKDGAYFFIDRAIPPLCMACPAGHIDEGEEHAEAIIREVKEETGFEIVETTLVAEHEFIKNNPCSKGVGSHYWYLYRCTVGKRAEDFSNEKEVKSSCWLTPEEIYALDNLEEVWRYWFERLNIIPS